MHFFSDTVLQHLHDVIDLPDLTGTRYSIEAPVASGGMGVIYRARDRELDRDVALKVLRAPVEPSLAERMVEEARILARLEHPAIVPVHDAGTLADGRVFYAMKFVDGPRLDEYAAGDAPLVDRLRVFDRICEAVAFAHVQGIVHRDLKPSNVMVGRFGEVLVMDWGVAKVLGRTGHAGGAAPESRRAPGPTEHGTVLGTAGYMAPEQERGEVETIGPRTDVFALGVLLRSLLHPIGPMPRALAAVVAKATQPDPAARYDTVDALREDVTRFVAGLSVTALREGILDRAARVLRTYRTPLLLVLAYLLMRLVILAMGRF
jgi:eukaryotic-like serine/threonine-protein kinase